MRIIPKTFLITAAVLFGFFLVFQPVYNADAALVPCGRLADDPSTTDINETKPCETCDILVLASRIINFVLFTLVPAIAVLLYLIAGFMVLLGGANPGLVQSGKNIFKTTTYSLFIIFGAWLITNSVLKSIAGDSLFTQNWNKVVCENAPTSTGGGGGGPTTTQKYACSSTGQCVVNANCSGDNCYTGDPFCAGNCRPATVSCMFNGVDQATLNVCSGLQPPGGCGNSSCSQYLSSINTYAGGAASVNVLKSFLFVESSCGVRQNSGSSFGVMQLKPETASSLTRNCGMDTQANCTAAGGSWSTAGRCNVTGSWLIANPDKNICLGAAYINSIAAGRCGTAPGGIYACYNAGPGWSIESEDCKGEQSCSGGPKKAWECPFDNADHTICNTGLQETRQGAAYINYCMNNLKF